MKITFVFFDACRCIKIRTLAIANVAHTATLKSTVKRFLLTQVLFQTLHYSICALLKICLKLI